VVETPAIIRDGCAGLPSVASQACNQESLAVSTETEKAWDKNKLAYRSEHNSCAGLTAEVILNEEDP
jgi:hypothetical protein